MSLQVKVDRELQFVCGEAYHSGNITGRPSYRNLKVIYDDFFGKAIDSAYDWTVGSATGTDCTATITTPDCLTLTSGTVDEAQLTVCGALGFYGTYGCAIEVRARNDDVDELRHFIGFSDLAATEMPFLYSGTTLTSSASDAAGFILDMDATLDRYYGVSVNTNSDGAVINSGNVGTADSAWKTYRVEIVPNGTAADAYFYLNTSGNEIDPEADIIGYEAAAVAPAVALGPNVSIQHNGTSSETLDVDYIKVWGGRY